MTLVPYDQVFTFVEKVAEMIAETFGDQCEVVISDLNHPDAAILSIFNGHVSGRTVGDSLPPQAVERIQQSADGFFINYLDRKGDKEFKTSTLELRFGEHHLALCINYDCSVFSAMQKYLDQFMDIQRNTATDQTAAAVSSVEKAIDDVISRYGKEPRLMTKEDRLKVVSKLNDQGVFQYQKSIITAARRLGISRYTIYNYLNELKEQEMAGE